MVRWWGKTRWESDGGEGKDATRQGQTLATLQGNLHRPNQPSRRATVTPLRFCGPVSPMPLGKLRYFHVLGGQRPAGLFFRFITHSPSTKPAPPLSSHPFLPLLLLLSTPSCFCRHPILPYQSPLSAFFVFEHHLFHLQLSHHDLCQVRRPSSRRGRSGPRYVTVDQSSSQHRTRRLTRFNSSVQCHHHHSSEPGRC